MQQARSARRRLRFLTGSTPDSHIPPSTWDVNITLVQCGVEIGSACFVSRKGGTEGDSTWQLAVEWLWSTLDGPFLSFLGTSSLRVDTVES